jgi:hypothetical protein
MVLSRYRHGAEEFVTISSRVLYYNLVCPSSDRKDSALWNEENAKEIMISRAGGRTRIGFTVYCTLVCLLLVMLTLAERKMYGSSEQAYSDPVPPEIMTRVQKLSDQMLSDTAPRRSHS